MAHRTKKVGITVKYATRCGVSLRKIVKKYQIQQRARYACAFCGKTAVKSVSRGDVAVHGEELQEDHGRRLLDARDGRRGPRSTICRRPRARRRSEGAAAPAVARPRSVERREQKTKTAASRPDLSNP